MSKENEFKSRLSLLNALKSASMHPTPIKKLHELRGFMSDLPLSTEDDLPPRNRSSLRLKKLISEDGTVTFDSIMMSQSEAKSVEDGCILSRAGSVLFYSSTPDLSILFTSEVLYFEYVEFF